MSSKYFTVILSPEHQESEAGEHGGGDGGEDDGVGVPGHQLSPPGGS